MPDAEMVTRAGLQLPLRVVVGKNGAYWRDFGDYYSMAVTSEDNDPVVPIGIYELVLSVEEVAAIQRKKAEAYVASLDIDFNVLDLRDPGMQRAFLEALKKRGVPTENDGA